MQQSNSPRPESLEAKFRLMTILPYDKRAKRKHILVYGFILDWYHSKYGDALASVRHVVAILKERDPFDAGLFVGDVHSALSDLTAWGYLSQEKGSGRRASRYVPVWEKARSVQKTPNTTDNASNVLEIPNTCVLENQNATDVCVQVSPNKDPSTGPGHRTGSHVVGNSFEAAPVAPPTAGLAAAAAGPASGCGNGFTEFWKTWPRKHGLKKAKAEWDKILTDVDVIIEVAGDWAAHYAKHGTEMKWIPEPANWLKDERWQEDLPIVHGDSKKASILKAKANAPRKTVEVQTSKGDRVVDIHTTNVETIGMETTVTVTFADRDTPHIWTRDYALSNDDMNRQQEAQREFAALCLSVGIQTINDSSELHGHAVLVRPKRDGTMGYSPASANDNTREAA